MAAHTEGIRLLSVYDDEEEEEEEEEEDEDDDDDDDDEEEEHQRDPNPTDNDDGDGAPALPETALENPSPVVRLRSPLLADEVADRKTLASPLPPTPPLPQSQHSSPFPFTSPSPQPPPAAAPYASSAEPSDPQRMRRSPLAIVDYAHDEVAMSPEQEEGEITSGGRVVFGTELQIADGNVEGRTLQWTSHVLTPQTQPESSQPSDMPEQSKFETSMAMYFTGMEPEVAQLEEFAAASTEMQKDDPLSRFLPPPMATKCSEELQQKINRFLAYKKSGKSFNADLRNRKDYRNPDFLQHAVRYQDIDQIGTCFSKDVFDPHGYDKSDYYDEIEADMKRELERKEQERKKSPKVEFIAGGTQLATVAPILKTSTQIAGITQVAGISAAVSSGIPLAPVSVDPAGKETRQSKKTKWDKIDGDVMNPTLSSGHDSISAVGVHAALLTAANAGAGYTAFAQQKRKEAEEKRTGDRKFDKRS